MRQVLRAKQLAMAIETEVTKVTEAMATWTAQRAVAAFT